MRRFHQLLACLLATLWLPATLHCQLEDAGLAPHDHHATPHHAAAADDQPAPHDHPAHCLLVESWAFKLASATVAVPAPTPAAELNAPVTPTPLTLLPRVTAASSAPTHSPPKLAPPWQFLARAALLPGAPPAHA